METRSNIQARIKWKTGASLRPLHVQRIYLFAADMARKNGGIIGLPIGNKAEAGPPEKARLVFVKAAQSVTLLKVAERLPGPWIPTRVSRAVNEALGGPLVGVRPGSQAHARRHPALRVIRYIAEILHLHLVR